jgi:hypothetical protein
MRCNVCGGENLTAVEYRAGSIRAPAMECDKCHAIVLDEAAATSEEERDSVRLAKAARAAQSAVELPEGHWVDVDVEEVDLKEVVEEKEVVDEEEDEEEEEDDPGAIPGS